MMNWFNRVVEEVKGMEVFQKESSIILVYETERHPTISIMNGDCSSTLATYRFDIEVQQFYKESSGRDEIHYGEEDTFLTKRLYFQTVAQLLSDIASLFINTHPFFDFQDRLNEAFSDEKYANVKINFEQNYTDDWVFSIILYGKEVEKYYISYFKTSEFKNYSFEIYTKEYSKGNFDPYSPIETRTLFSQVGAVQDAVTKVDELLAEV